MNGPTSISIDLDTTNQTNEGIHEFQLNYKTINSIFFNNSDVTHQQEQQQQQQEANSADTNFLKNRKQNFMRILECVASKAGPGPKSQTRFFCFNNQLIGIDEAYLLVQIIKALKQHKTQVVSLVFHCEVSTDAFQYLIRQCGIKKSCATKTKNLFFQSFLISGMGIQSSHAKCITPTLKHTECITPTLKHTELLESLVLQYTNIGDDGAIVLADALCQNKSLTLLNLHASGIEFQGAKALGNMLQQNASLQVLILSRNKIGSNGIISLANSLHVNSSLQQLFLVQVDHDNKGLRALASCLLKNKSLKHLDLSYNFDCGYSLEAMQALGSSVKSNCTLSSLVLTGILSFDGDGRIIGSFVNALDGKANKIKIELDKNGDAIFGTSAMKSLIQCNAPLLSLDLGCNEFKSSHIEAIIFGIQQDTFNIQALNLDYAEINDHNIKLLFDVLVEKNENKSLLSSSSSHCYLIELSLKMIEGLSQKGAQYLVCKLPFTNIQRLFLANVPIGDCGVQQIASYLNDTNLTKLGLVNVGMNDSSLVALSAALKYNTKLTHLFMNDNPGITKKNNNNIMLYGKQALLNVLRDYNMTLIEINVEMRFFQRKNDKKDETIDHKIKFYTELNKANRQKLCNANCVPATLLPFILECQTFNPSIMYWMLRMCPHVICFHQ